MNNMYEILSDNLVRLRKSRNLTQAEFADIIKYSDKSVSKWETGMSVPSLETLVDIADYYGMTLDDLVKKPVDNEKVLAVEKIKKNNKLSIMLLAITSVWLLATILFMFLLITKESPGAWKSFIWAIPLTFIFTTIFSSIWKPKYIYISSSIFLWTLITAIFLQLPDKNKLFLLYVIGVPLQIIIILSRGLRKDIVEESAERQSLIMKLRIERQKERKARRAKRVERVEKE